eukprot:6825617-Alexandrium_andersonii.AAC.1
MAGDSPKWPWMIRHAGTLISRCRTGTDGKTAYGRIKGHECVREHLEFGERVMYLRPQSAGMHKADPIWDIGVWLGVIK